jgi:hypothetical protein
MDLITSSELREMKSLARKKVGVVKISKSLKRTVGATAVKARQLGISLSTQGDDIAGWVAQRCSTCQPCGAC